MKKGKKKETKKKRKAKVKKEEINEIFDVEKEGKERTIRTHKEIEKKEEIPPKRQIKKENKILRNVIIIMFGFALMFLIVYVMMYYNTHFEIEGVKFEVTKVGELTLYKTSLPGIINKSGNFEMGVYDTGQKADYNIYLRNDPRELKSIPFHGRITQIKKENVINLGDDFNCNGDGMIAIANLLKLYEVIGANMIKDENASCDEKGTYGWINIQKGNETELERLGPACFDISINDCEILKGTEKFMLDTLIEVNNKIELVKESKEND